MMLGFLLARAGVDVMVLEKHADFLRDFRGDTVHPSTLEMMHELGLLEEFLKLPHHEGAHARRRVRRRRSSPSSISAICRRAAKFIALMPQWDFLNFLAGHGERYPGFHLRMRDRGHRSDRGGRPRHRRARQNAGRRRSRSAPISSSAATGGIRPLRERAGIEGRRPRRADGRAVVPPAAQARRSDAVDRPASRPARIFVMIDRGDYWQCAYVIPKGSIEEIHRAGLEAFRAGRRASMPFFADRVGELTDWDDVKLLTVAVDRMPRWYRPGLLCIGDAAHAMSPIGGVGINLAVQDAVAAANILWRAARGAARERGRSRARAEAARISRRASRRRSRFSCRTASSAARWRRKANCEAPLALRLLGRFPPLRRIPARLLGLGVRPEHVRTPAARR